MSSDTPTIPDASEPAERRQVRLPAFLFVATCLSTLWVGAVHWKPLAYLEVFHLIVTGQLPQDALAKTHLQMDWWQGLTYMGFVLAILLTHEMGHFLAALRYRIPASLPYFIPVPIIPFGTLGAVIGMEGSRANRRELFDLGIAGPLAGLAVAIPVLWIGILQLDAAPVVPDSFIFHNPLLVQQMIAWIRPGFPTPGQLSLEPIQSLPDGRLARHLVTGLNTLPISQFDGGHVAYALLRAAVPPAGPRAAGGRDCLDGRQRPIHLDSRAPLGDPARRRPPAHGRRRLPARLVPASDRLGLSGAADSLLPPARHHGGRAIAEGAGFRVQRRLRRRRLAGSREPSAARPHVVLDIPPGSVDNRRAFGPLNSAVLRSAGWRCAVPPNRSQLGFLPPFRAGCRWLATGCTNSLDCITGCGGHGCGSEACEYSPRQLP